MHDAEELPVDGHVAEAPDTVGEPAVTEAPSPDEEVAEEATEESAEEDVADPVDEVADEAAPEPAVASDEPVE